MDHGEALEVLETISELYPNKFEITERVARMLIPQLREMDFSAVMDKLSKFAVRHPFPPTIAEIAVYLPEENKHLIKMREWEKEAASVSEETKHRFRERIHQLVKEMSRDS
ncbi:hypothetical protein MUO14_07470 [Halobacillus shinanisalinarum]|uniref:Replicative helicase inhibitor G39P N-terminal domain-containing protein n=1 Tax=Halobacillus shinanisalinarum TaxID=2932258 RepID=A0ABY4H2W9_9BACI|nr:hypothetical protein [Halobacillus shinanisalinarum]UOQ94763.1 hypothetical protein MUO14_07470 [Halobacillus shinanisalinarum]